MDQRRFRIRLIILISACLFLIFTAAIGEYCYRGRAKRRFLFTSGKIERISAIILIGEQGRIRLDIRGPEAYVESGDNIYRADPAGVKDVLLQLSGIERFRTVSGETEKDISAQNFVRMIFEDKAGGDLADYTVWESLSRAGYHYVLDNMRVGYSLVKNLGGIINKQAEDWMLLSVFPELQEETALVRIQIRSNKGYIFDIIRDGFTGEWIHSIGRRLPPEQVRVREMEQTLLRLRGERVAPRQSADLIGHPEWEVGVTTEKGRTNRMKLYKTENPDFYFCYSDSFEYPFIIGQWIADRIINLVSDDRL